MFKHTKSFEPIIHQDQRESAKTRLIWKMVESVHVCT